MVLLESTATSDLAYDWESTAPAEGETSARYDQSGDPLNAARGMALAAVLGSMVWAVILWGLL